MSTDQPVTDDRRCPRCGAEADFDLTCHTWTRRRDDGSEQWMSCVGCASAVYWFCDGEACDWHYTEGLNHNNPRAEANEKNRPSWLREEGSGVLDMGPPRSLGRVIQGRVVRSRRLEVSP